ncbi:MAG: HU family DNA-binding protein [Thermoanaerobaculum sp.]|nr:HU family DNA-binding protein [Thermoanaerobaculum sp.]
MPGKAEIVSRVVFETGMPKAHAARALEILVDALQEWVAAGERVAIPGLGVFYASERVVGKRRNPQTGEQLPPRPVRVARFRPAKEFKELLNAKK